MPDAALRPWITSEFVTAPHPERERPEIKWWDQAVYAALDLVRRPLLARRLRLSPIVTLTEAHAAATAALSDAGLLATAAELKGVLLHRGFQPDLAARAFALMREAGERHLGMRHRPVQILGGYAMLNGRIAEMRTGEGKTITAMLPAAAAALAGVPVHVVTVNDYLAKRDAEQLAPAYAALGLSTGLIVHGMDPAQRRQAYACNIVYASNKEIVFDYLRDRIAIDGRPSAARMMAARLAQHGADGPTMMRGLFYAIVDEADSVLIDEARTPLIISRQTEGEMSEQLCRRALETARGLAARKDFALAAAERRVTLTPEGRDKLKSLAAEFEGHWRAKRAREELVEQAIAAIHFYHRDQHYIVADDKVQIVDEYTGRTMPDRQWQRGLQQLIEAKEAVPVTGRRDTLGQLTYQRFFRRYLWLSGMTGTAREVAGELERVYGLSVIPIPTHRPPIAQDRGLALHRTAAGKWEDVVQRALDIGAQGRPVLIGTRSVAASEHLATLFVQRGVAHVVLNARNDAQEAELVAEAGTPGRITIATNMAGRGTDIRLRGKATENGGLHVILTEFHESARIDRQLFGRCGRQGDPGSFEAVVSLEDDLFTLFATWPARLCRAAMGKADPEWFAHAGRWLRFIAQSNAERQHARARRRTVKNDRALEKALAFAKRPE